MYLGHAGRHLARKVKPFYTLTRIWSLVVCFVLATGGVSLADTLATDAADDSATISSSGATVVDVISNDTAISGGVLTIIDVTQGANGTVVIANDGSALTYEPAPDSCGMDMFSYSISDGLGGTDTAAVTVDVECVEVTPPVEPSPPPVETTTTTTVAPTTTTTAPAIDLDTATNLIVKLVPGLSADEQASVIEAKGAVETSKIDVLRLHMVAVAPDTAEESIAAFLADPAVVSVDVDQPRVAEAAPSDPGYSDQWALPMIGFDDVYGTVTPSGSTTLAVLDTGVDGNDPDLASRLVGGWSFDGSDPATDANGHGTHVATIAAAGVDDGVGIAGVGFAGVSIMPVRVLGDDGSGNDSDIIEGLVWAVQNGADVVVMAFSNPGESAALQFAVNYAWTNGVVLVAAAGNDGSSAPTYPAGLAKVVGVGATNQSDNVWSGSNVSDSVFMVAPGVDIASSTGSVTGTSASAAMVAGAAAVMQANDPGASPSVIVGRLARNAEAVDGVAGNGRLHLGRSLTDESTAGVSPVGVPGGGGPIVGPYVTAAADFITGRVLVDTDGDGVDDDGGIGLAGATVKLYRDSNTNNIFDPATDALLGTVTTLAGTNGPTGTSGAWSFRQNGASGINEATVAFNNNTTYFVQRTNPSGYTSTSALLGAFGGNGTGHADFVVSVDVIRIRFENANPTYSNARFLAKLSVVTADLSITKVDTPDPVLPTAILTYTITVSNGGPGAVTGAVVTDNFPAALTGATWSCSITTGTGSCGSPASGNSGNISRSIDLSSGAVATFTATGTVSPSASGNISNTATVTAPAGVIDPNATNNSATSSTLVAAPALTIDKTSVDTSYSAVGDVLDYSFKVTNSGNVTLTGPFTVADNKATDESCPATASLAPGAFITCTASYTVTQADLDAGSVINTATGSGTFGATTVTSPSDSVTISANQTRALTIDKTSTDSSYIAVGDVLDYSFKVTNSGNVTLTGPFSVTDNKATDESCPATSSLAPGAFIICTAS